MLEDVKKENKAWLSDKSKIMPDIDIPEDFLTILGSFLKTWLGSPDIKKVNDSSFKVGSDGPLVTFIPESDIYYFQVHEKEDQLIQLPKLSNVNADWGIDFEKILPKSIIDVYNCLRIKQIEFWIGETFIAQTEFFAQNINIFGLNFDLLQLQLLANFATESEYSIKVGLQYHDLILEGNILNNDVVLKGQCQKPIKTFNQFVNDFSGFSMPEWLNKHFEKISKIEGELRPFSKNYNFQIHIDEQINIFSIGNELSVKLKRMCCQISNDTEDQKVSIKIEGQLEINNCEVAFEWRNNDKNFDVIQGKINKDNINSFIGFIFKKIGIKSNASQFKSDLNYSLGSNKIEIVYENFFISAVRKTNGDWDYTVSVKANLSDFREELMKCMPDFIVEPISKTDFKLAYINQSIVIGVDIPVHEIKQLKPFLGDSKCYIPLEVKKQTGSWKCSIEKDIGLPSEINFLSMKLMHPKIKIQDSKLHLESGLSLGLMSELKGSLAIGRNSFTGSFRLETDIAILGIVLKGLEAAIEINPTLNITAKAQFEMAGENKQKMGPSSYVELGFTAGAIKFIKIFFPPGVPLSIKGLAQFLIPLKDRPFWKEKIDKLYELFPVSIGPIQDEGFKQAIEKSGDQKLIDLLKNQLIFCIDLLDPSLTISGEINLGEIFSAFIVSDINLRTGLKLLASMKPIDLFQGKIKITKSTYQSPDHKSSIDLAGPTLDVQVPGWESLFNFKQLTQFHFHGDAFIEFLGFQFDSSINVNYEGFDLYLRSKLECPVFISTGLIHVIGNKKGFSFTLNTKITIYLSVIETRLVDANCNIHFSYQINETGFIIQARGSLELSLLEMFNKSLSFDLNIPIEDSVNLPTLVSAIPKFLAKMDMNELNEGCSKDFHKRTLINLQSDGNLSDSFDTQYFDANQIEEFGPEKIRIALLRYLLRINNPTQISEAFKIINDIEETSVSETIENIHQRAIQALESNPIMTFCYLRFMEIHLLSNVTELEKLALRGLVRYYLGIMYANKNVPMSNKFGNYSRLDQIVEDKSPTLTYLSDIELSRQAISYFGSACLDFDASKQNKLLALLPLYQLWHHRDSMRSEIKKLSPNIQKKIFGEKAENNKGNDSFLNWAYNKIFANNKKIEKFSAEEMKIALIILINFYYQNVDHLDFKNIPLGIKKPRSPIRGLADSSKYSQRISALLDCKSQDKNISLYQKMIKFYINNNQNRDKGDNSDITTLLQNIKKSRFEPILDQKYAWNFIPDLYYKNGVYFQDRLLKAEEGEKNNLIKECKNSFKKALAIRIYSRRVFYYPGSPNNEYSVKIIMHSPEIMAHKNLYDIYMDNSFPKESKCLSKANYHGMKYLKYNYFSIEKFKFNGVVINPYDFSVIKFDQFYEGCQKPTEKSFLALFNSGIATIRLMEEALTVFNEFKPITPHDEIRTVLTHHADILLLEIFRFYMLALQCNYLPAFFELEKILKIHRISMILTTSYNSSIFDSLNNLPKLTSDCQYPVKELMDHAENLKTNQIQFFSSNFKKINIFMNVKPNLESHPALDAKAFENPSNKINKLGKSIDDIYHKMTEPQKHELNQIKSQTTLFREDKSKPEKSRDEVRNLRGAKLISNMVSKSSPSLQK